jgi:HPt (histidine-containing phosphotransfer) domain-containing protein
MGQRKRRTPDHAPSDAQSELAELRAHYRRELPHKIQAVKDAAAALGNVYEREEGEALHLLAHRLVGSAAIYGFGAVSEAAAALEAFVVETLEATIPPSDVWRQRLLTLVAALERAAAEPR